MVKNFQFQNYLTKTCKNKNNYYHSFKTQLGGWLGVRCVILIDPSQGNNKNNYYHSCKI